MISKRYQLMVVIVIVIVIVIVMMMMMMMMMMMLLMEDFLHQPPLNCSVFLSQVGSRDSFINSMTV